MNLDAQNCALLAQIVPVFVLALVLEAATLGREVDARGFIKTTTVIVVLISNGSEGGLIYGALGDGLQTINAVFVVVSLAALLMWTSSLLAARVMRM